MIKQVREIPRLLMDAHDTARALSISERTLWELTNKGEIPCVPIGRRILYDPRVLQVWVGGQADVSGFAQAGDGESAEPCMSHAGIHVEGGVGTLVVQKVEKGGGIVCLRKNHGDDPPASGAWADGLFLLLAFAAVIIIFAGCNGELSQESFIELVRMLLDRMFVIGRFATLFAERTICNFVCVSGLDWRRLGYENVFTAFGFPDPLSGRRSCGLSPPGRL